MAESADEYTPFGSCKACFAHPLYTKFVLSGADLISGIMVRNKSKNSECECIFDIGFWWIKSWEFRRFDGVVLGVDVFLFGKVKVFDS